MIKKGIKPLVMTAFIAVVIVLGLLTAVSWYANKKLVEATSWVDHSHEVLTTLEQIKSHLVQAESAQRGYFLQQAPKFLIERENALVAARAGILTIEQLTADNFGQRRRVDLLRNLLLQRSAVFIETQAIQDSMGDVAKAGYFANGAVLFAKLQDVTEKIKAEEKELLALRSTDETMKIQFARKSFILLTASLIIVLFLLVRQIYRDIGLQEQGGETLRIAHAELETRVKDRTTELEATNVFLNLEIAGHKVVEKALQDSQYLLDQLSAHQESIKEGERKRIAREIHDELGQRLLVLRIDVSLLQTRTLEPHALFPEKISAVLEDIAAIMQSVRAIINDLRPAVLDLGLHAAIEWQLKQFQHRTGIECVLLPSSQEVELTDSGATSLFRILQESLTNVRRHSQATRVEVALNEDEGGVLMSVSDNGVGTDSVDYAKKNSFGLLGMKERISRLDGCVGIVTEQGSGFKIIVSIPNQVRETLYAPTPRL